MKHKLTGYILTSIIIILCVVILSFNYCYGYCNSNVDLSDELLSENPELPKIPDRPSLKQLAKSLELQEQNPPNNQIRVRGLNATELGTKNSNFISGKISKILKK